MNTEDVKQLANIRQYVIECHDSLDGATAINTAVVKQADVAHEYVNIIHMLETVLKPYVNFE